MVLLKKYVINAILIVKYCIIHKLPVFATFQKFWKLWKEEQAAPHFIMQTGYLEHPESFYLPESYYKRALEVNSMAACDLLDNKTVLYKRCPKLLGRECLVLSECTESEITDFMKRHIRFVGKRNYGSVGRQFASYDTSVMSLDKIRKEIRKNRQLLLEEYIDQHEVISRIYPHCVNTLRIHTVNNGKEIHNFLDTLLRVGCNNAALDVNETTGCYRLMLNPDGTIAKSVYINSFGWIKKAVKHHNTGVSFEQIKVPYVMEAIDLAKEAAGYFPEVPYIGWDIAITPDGPVVVEGNAVSGAMITYQLIHNLYHGTGLRKEIDEMLDFCLSGREDL